MDCLLQIGADFFHSRFAPPLCRKTGWMSVGVRQCRTHSLVTSRSVNSNSNGCDAYQKRIWITPIDGKFPIWPWPMCERGTALRAPCNKEPLQIDWCLIIFIIRRFHVPRNKKKKREEKKKTPCEWMKALCNFGAAQILVGRGRRHRQPLSANRETSICCCGVKDAWHHVIRQPNGDTDEALGNRECGAVLCTFTSIAYPQPSPQPYASLFFSSLSVSWL